MAKPSLIPNGEPTPSGVGLTYTGDNPIRVGQSPDVLPETETGTGRQNTPDFDPASVPVDHNGVSMTPNVMPDQPWVADSGVKTGLDIKPDQASDATRAAERGEIPQESADIPGTPITESPANPSPAPPAEESAEPLPAPEAPGAPIVTERPA